LPAIKGVNPQITKIGKPFKQGADFEHLRQVAMRETTAGPVSIIELSADAEIMARVTGIDFPPSDYNKLKTMNQDGSLEEIDMETMEIGMHFMDLSVSFSKAVGYDYVTASAIVPTRRTRANLKKDPNHEETVRIWQEEHQGIIMSREDYDAYTWPSTDSINLLALDLLPGIMPPEMKVLCFVMGIFEDLRMLMGFEQMAVKSIEEPELLGDILENLTVLCEAAWIERLPTRPAVPSFSRMTLATRTQPFCHLISCGSGSFHDKNGLHTPVTGMESLSSSIAADR